ncbi:response regulator transcription factor [Paenibacillus humicus]|uniref:response regulator transcription factor n=1 Tax=Paenibacillus humicus TaxID=412861 RepID=UPI000FD8D898|nr:response regulator [Paenibacillus humicus]
MLSALIVDDEYEIREGLRRRIPWSEFGIGTVLVADDGDEALTMAAEARPDLIITDIKMNRMSGLELLDALREVPDYDWQAVLISGYDDFELVKQGMQLSAMDYILKPINREELERIVRRAVDLIVGKRMDKQSRELMNDQMRLAMPKLREELLREIVESDYDPYRETRVLHRLKALQLGWLEKTPLMLLMAEPDDLKAVASQRSFPSEKELILFGIGNVMSQTLQEEYPGEFTLFTDSGDRWIAVLGSRDGRHPEQSLAVAGVCLQRINQFVKVKASIALTSVPKDWSHLHAQYVECGEWLEQKALYGGNRLFTETMDEESRHEGPLSIREPADALDLVRYGSDQDITAAMAGFVDMVKGWELATLKDIQQQLFKWLMGICRAASAAGWADRTWEKDPIALWEQLELYDNLLSLQEHAETVLLSMAADFRRMTEPTSQIVHEAEKIIASRFGDNLSLQAVAEEVHVTPVWLSKLFKKEKGKTFLEALTETRMARAKEMLGDVKFKIYQISYQVGYKDPVHFTKLFKKQTGITPKEYRRQRGILDD